MTDRRSFLRGALGAGVAGVAGAATGAGIAVAVSGTPAAAADVSTNPTSAVPFHGVRQAGVTTPLQLHASVLSLDVEVSDRAGLEAMLRTLTERARFLTRGGTPPDPGIAAPPTDSGVLGPVVVPDNLTITVGVGASLFDGRFGLAGKRPAELTAMPTFPDDHLDPDLTHGDLSLQVCADNRDTVGHAVRDIAKIPRGAFAVRWRVDGFQSPPRPSGTPRNLMGFKDGTANLDKTDNALMNRQVWIESDAEQPWIAGGSYQVIRMIRMLIEFWDRIGITEQEKLIGRRRDTGAPMDGNARDGHAGLPGRPGRRRDPVDQPHPAGQPAHAADRGEPDPAPAVQLRQRHGRGRQPRHGPGLRRLPASIARQFETIQKRLEGEPLVDYIQPVGGGYFLALPGVRDDTDFFGRTMLA